MKNRHVVHGSSIAQRNWPLATSALAALLTTAASFGTGADDLDDLEEPNERRTS
jgi:hypothetical protein